VPEIPLPQPPLTDGLISLRAWRRADVPALTAACQDPEIPRWTLVPSPYTERHAEGFVEHSGAARREGRELALAVVDRHDDLLGAIGLTGLDWDNLKGEIGFWIARDSRGRGVGVAATRLLSEWAIEELGLSRLELLAHPGNEPSQRLAARAGYTREGVLRKYRRRRGEQEDLIMFALLAEDLGG
jgi:RimJ/RimL family protein N-acetyltransferase